MNIRLEFHLRNHSQYTKPVDEKLLLDQLRQDIILQANNDNKLICRFQKGCYFKDSLDITGYTLKLIVKENPTDADDEAVLTKTLTDVDFTDAVNGEANIVITKEDCEDLLGNYLYEIGIITKNGKTHSIALGIMSFIQSLFVA